VIWESRAVCPRVPGVAVPTVLLASVLLVHSARAGAPVLFDYNAPAECPSRADFLERVRARAPRVELTEDSAVARRFVVTVGLDAKGARARVDFAHATGAQVSRSIRGETCDEVVSGIALISALALEGRVPALSDPDPVSGSPAAEGSASFPQSPGQAAPQPPSVADAAESALVPSEPLAPTNKPVPKSTAASAVVSGETQPEPRAPRRSTVAPLAPRFAAGVGAGFASHSGPSGAPFLDAFFAANLFARRAVARGSVWHFRSSAETADGKVAHFRGYGLRLEGCVRLLDDGRFYLDPCLATDVGVLSGSAEASPALIEPRDSLRGWWSSSAVARLSAAFSGRLLLEVQGEFAVPVLVHRYGFGDPPANQALWEVPRVGMLGRAGVGYLFP